MRLAGLLFAGFALLFSGLLHGQVVGDFRTIANVDFAAATNWERYNGAWVPAVVYIATDCYSIAGTRFYR